MPNDYQRAAMASYGDGAYVNIKHDIVFDGDTLALFIWRELADDGTDTMTRDIAVSRLATAISDLQDARDSVAGVQEETPAQHLRKIAHLLQQSETYPAGLTSIDISKLQRTATDIDNMAHKLSSLEK